MRVVAVSQRIDQFPARDETRDALDQRLIAFLLSVGFLPVPVPNGLANEFSRTGAGRDALDVWIAVVKPHAVLLSGGNDIGHCFLRDVTESRLLDHAKQHLLPVLGLCRGMQMMAHWAGVGLHPVQGHVRTLHKLSGEIAGGANSFHGFSLTDCPDGFQVLARSEDGEIEAIRHCTLPWEGWMWHPERDAQVVTRDVERIKALFGSSVVEAG